MKNLYHEGFTQNREISNLRFNERILEEACDKSVPLLERLRFVSIFYNNLEEFYMVRVGSLTNDVNEGDDTIDEVSGLTPADQLKSIKRYAEELLKLKDRITEELTQELADNGIMELDYSELGRSELRRATDYYNDNVKPLLDVRILKPGEKLDINQFELYYLVRLEVESGEKMGIIRIPSELEPIMTFSNSIYGISYMKLEKLIEHRMRELFFPFPIKETLLFDITRNGEVELESSGNQLKDMKKVVSKRTTEAADRLIMDRIPSDEMLSYLVEALDIRYDQAYVADTISYAYVDSLINEAKGWPGRKLVYESFEPFNILSLRNSGVIDLLKTEELLIRYPYESMEPFLQLLEEAATDKRVKEIRMTIYRLSSNPRIRELLIKAASNGVKVRILIELRARFDEDRNIGFAEEFQKAGCEVYYGSDNYKVHSKLCQIVLDEGKGETYITHIGTGNFNEKTAKMYTDLSLITYDQRIGKDADKLFRNIFKGKIGHYEHLSTSPENMYEMLISNIRKQAELGENGRIFIKCNSLNEPKLIEELMLASCKGCKITLVVRGICCILPGIPDCTENIQVMNIVGRFLEHSRVYIFGQGDKEKMYISSADLMKRNMHKRIEVACPIYSKRNREKIKKVMQLNVMDNQKGRLMKSDGTYVKKAIKDQIIDSQALLLKYSSIK